MEKVIIIDDISVIIRDKNFIRDNIPRFLSKCIDDGFKIWLRVDKIDTNDILNYNCIPVWLKQNTIFVDDDILQNLKNFKFSKDSFIISNSDKPLVDQFNHIIDLDVYNGFDLFDYKNYYRLNFSDLVLCFGFNDKEFKDFCRESNLIKFDKVEKLKDIDNGYDGIAYMIKTDNLEIEYNNIKERFTNLVKTNKYKIKHKGFTIGAINNGRGIDSLNLNIINGKKLPLVLV